jgi:Asp-tRNA(Asn)/Glu-tRNA(Gln) amidotransferase A subunit family amidase
MMLIGRHFEDATVLRAAYAYEQSAQPAAAGNTQPGQSALQVSHT